MDAAAAIPADGDPAVLAAADLLARVTDGRPAVLEGLQLVLARIHGRDLRFVSDRRRDPIQRAHRAGTFYEAEELEVIRRAVPPGAVFVDIGANVGNHSPSSHPPARPIVPRTADALVSVDASPT